MSTPSNVILITGGNRGIGLALVQSYSNDSNNIIFVGARDPTQANEVHALSKSSQAKIHLIKLTSGDVSDNESAAKEVERIAGHVDVLIANAGIANGNDKIIEAPLDSFIDHYNVNFLGPVVLIQSFWNLVKKSPLAHPKFIVISTIGASIAIAPNLPFNLAPYGSSKAAVNYLVARLAAEEKERGLIAVPIHPGAVSSEMGKRAIASLGLAPDAEVPGLTIITPKESGDALKKVIDGLDIESSGKFLSYDGSSLPW